MLYPIGIQNLEDIRRGGYVYVDKTALIYKLHLLGNITSWAARGGSARVC